MYNYFSSKEMLLSSIIKRSVAEVYESFDLNRDGSLSQEEFEYFIRQTARILKEKKNIWRLFFQLMMQHDVREQFLKLFVGSGSILEKPDVYREEYFISGIMTTINDYFVRKKDKKGADYDPALDLNMFIMTLKGFALTYVYLDDYDELFLEKTVNTIIETYK